jgi:ParB/RepB/Spo0J family partition protein
MEVEEIEVDKIKPDRDQPRRRFDEEKLKQLAETFKTQGVIQPIEVDEDYVIITGERRWRAAKLAGLKKIPCRIIRGLTPDQKLERRLIENIHHEPLTDLEKAEAIKRYIEMKGCSILSAADNLGMGPTYLRYLLSLLEAPHEVKRLVEGGKIDPSTAGEIVYALKDKPEKAVEVVKKVAKAEKNKRQLARMLVKEVKLREREIEVPRDEFNVIYADPPWEYDFSVDEARSIPIHYPTMKLEEICSYLKDKGVRVAEDAVLFLWATNPKLEEAFQVIRAWGFNYRTNFVWVKDKIGMGYWNRSLHELLLIATRGNPKPPTPERRFPSVIEARRGVHSEKPEIVYTIIEEMFPTARKLELFARKKRDGWEAVGLEIEGYKYQKT